MIARHKIAGAGVIKGLDFAKSGRFVNFLALAFVFLHGLSRRLVTNSSDRTLRQFILPTYPTPPPTLSSSSSSPSTLTNATFPFIDNELEPTHRFNDPINRTAWHAMCFSPDGEWLAGGAADPAAHKIYIWDISNDGQFASALDGGREPLVHLHVRGVVILSLLLLAC